MVRMNDHGNSGVLKVVMFTFMYIIMLFAIVLVSGLAGI